VGGIVVLAKFGMNFRLPLSYLFLPKKHQIGHLFGIERILCVIFSRKYIHRFYSPESQTLERNGRSSSRRVIEVHVQRR